MLQSPERKFPSTPAETTSEIPGICDRLDYLLPKAEERYGPGEEWRFLNALLLVARDHPELRIGPETAHTLTHPSFEAYLPLVVPFDGQTYACIAARTQFADSLSRPKGDITKGGIRYIGVDELQLDSFHTIGRRSVAWDTMWDDLFGLGLAMKAKNAGVDFRDFMEECGLLTDYPILEPLDVVGGAKGVIIGPRNPHLPDHNAFIARALEEYAYALTMRGVIGWDRDVPAGDQYTTGSYEGKSVMDWVVKGHARALAKMGKGIERPENLIAAVVTGKSPTNFGHPLRATATALGTIEAFKAWVELKGINPRDLKIVFDGAGNAALPAAKAASEMGAQGVGITDTRSVLSAPNGLSPEDIENIEKVKREGGSLADFAKERNSDITAVVGDKATVANGKMEMWQRSKLNVLFASSAERVINAGNVEALPDSCLLIVDGANGAVTPRAEKVLERKGVEHMTGGFANAGGVTCSLVEWAGNVANTTIDPKTVEQVIRYVIRRNLSEMRKLVQSGKVNSLEDAFYYMAILRLLQRRQRL